MSTLLLRFAAPLQSWGASSRYQQRGTELAPTKSAVVGMLAAALGRRRSDSIDDLQGIQLGVRIDQPGSRIKDFHTAHTDDGKQAFVSDRFYLADSVFLIGIQDKKVRLRQFERALQAPSFPLYLGRRSCPPAPPFIIGIKDGVNLLAALQTEPWQASVTYQKKLHREQQVKLEIIIDAQFGAQGSFVLRDLPLTFNQVNRQYASRSVISYLSGTSVTNPFAELVSTNTEHDALGALEV